MMIAIPMIIIKHFLLIRLEVSVAGMLIKWSNTTYETQNAELFCFVEG